MGWRLQKDVKRHNIGEHPKAWGGQQLKKDFHFLDPLGIHWTVHTISAMLQQSFKTIISANPRLEIRH